VSLVGAPYPREQVLQHTPTVAAIVWLAIDTRRDRMSLASFACITLFFWLHILGARYIYSFVPYDDWSRVLTGQTLSGQFGWHRNHYDRLVHVAYGMLFVVPFFEWGTVRGAMSRGWALQYALLAVLATGALYEIFEWLLSVVMAPDWAEAYNGQQGDPWDAQKDMFLALAGSLFTAMVISLTRWESARPASSEQD
jgi:putative membrane protein